MVDPGVGVFVEVSGIVGAVVGDDDCGGSLLVAVITVLPVVADGGSVDILLVAVAGSAVVVVCVAMGSHSEVLQLHTLTFPSSIQPVAATESLINLRTLSPTGPGSDFQNGCPLQALMIVPCTSTPIHFSVLVLQIAKLP